MTRLDDLKKASHMTVTWEALYPTWTQKEVDGAKYSDLDRERITGFRLVTPEGVALEIALDIQKDKDSFVYRRRTAIVQGGPRKVLFIVGFMPDGPWYLYSSDDGTMETVDTLDVMPAHQPWEPDTYWPTELI